ncbi:alkaline phosphatase PhoX [Micromonospora sp. BRA006-A]|nr:alkaline phosphatase PhoX [Micromonospora sp. BRA006-A]
MVDTEISRRGVVRAGAVGALVLGFGGAAAGALAGAAPAAAAPAAPPVPGGGEVSPAGAGRPGSGALTFKPIPPNKLDTLVVPNGYDHSVVIRWGDEVVPGAPAFSLGRQPPPPSPSSSATTTTSSACCRSTGGARCSWSTTSTRTRT